MKKLAKNEKGLTLLEILVAVFVLVIVAVPLLNMFVYNAGLVKRADNIGDTTYLAQSVMEDLQTLGYGALYAQSPAPGLNGSYQIKSVVNSSTVFATKTISIDRVPYGTFGNLVGGTACYAHLIVGSGGTMTFTCPNGTITPSLPVTSAVTLSSSQVTIGSNAYSLGKPAGTNLILIINAGTYPVSSLTITLPSDKSVPYVLYALSQTDPAVQQNFTINNGSANSKEYRKYLAGSDPTPSYMLVRTVCKVYQANNVTVDSMFQSTLTVNLP